MNCQKCEELRADNVALRAEVELFKRARDKREKEHADFIKTLDLDVHLELAQSRADNAALRKEIDDYKKAYNLTRDAAILDLYCHCSVDERLSGHKTACQVSLVEYKINLDDERQNLIEQTLSKGETE